MGFRGKFFLRCLPPSKASLGIAIGHSYGKKWGIAAIVCDTTENAVRQGSCNRCLAMGSGYFGRVIEQDLRVNGKRPETAKTGKNPHGHKWGKMVPKVGNFGAPTPGFCQISSTAKLRIWTLRTWGFRGPGFRSARQVLCGDASRLFLYHFSKHPSSVSGRTELCHEVRNPKSRKSQIIRNEKLSSKTTTWHSRAPKTSSHPQRKPPLGTP